MLREVNRTTSASKYDVNSGV